MFLFAIASTAKFARNKRVCFVTNQRVLSILYAAVILNSNVILILDGILASLFNSNRMHIYIFFYLSIIYLYFLSLIFLSVQLIFTQIYFLILILIRKKLL